MKLSPTCDGCGAELWGIHQGPRGCRRCFERFRDSADYCARCVQDHDAHVAKRAEKEGWLSVHPETPAFKHDCDDCVFLGRYYPGGGEPVSDLYTCMKGPGRTFIGRYGNDGAEYVSGAPMAAWVPALAEARQRAQAKGIV